MLLSTLVYTLPYKGSSNASIYYFTMSDMIVLNVNGTKFEISNDVFLEMKSRTCTAAEKLRTEHIKGKNEFVIERGIYCFQSVLGYFQGRGLHMPASVCTMEFKAELEFWGIEPSEMENCCYSKYVSFFDDQSALKILETDQLNKIAERKDLHERSNTSGWRAVQAKAWLILEEPTYSLFARVR